MKRDEKEIGIFSPAFSLDSFDSILRLGAVEEETSLFKMGKHCIKHTENMNQASFFFHPIQFSFSAEESLQCSWSCILDLIFVLTRTSISFPVLFLPDSFNKGSSCEKQQYS